MNLPIPIFVETKQDKKCNTTNYSPTNQPLLLPT